MMTWILIAYASGASLAFSAMLGTARGRGNGWGPSIFTCAILCLAWPALVAFIPLVVIYGWGLSVGKDGKSREIWDLASKCAGNDKSR